MAIKIGVIGTADIAKRRMIPAIKKANDYEYAGVAIADSSEWDEPHSENQYKSILEKKKNKAYEFLSLFGSKLYIGYETLLKDSSINAVYIPLPPSLHYKWARKALEYGKNVLLEKPFTTNYNDTISLINLAREKRLAITENYGFIFHPQFKEMQRIFLHGDIGDLRLIRACFGFPHRSENDFRYSKKYGGGALFDCGGYTIRAVMSFMNNPEVLSSVLITPENYEVDVYGDVTLTDGHKIAQLSFGMDNSYKCDLELWGSIGCLTSDRIYTAPDSFNSVIKLKNQYGIMEIQCGLCDQFLEVLTHFHDCINNVNVRDVDFQETLKIDKIIADVLIKNIV